MVNKISCDCGGEFIQHPSKQGWECTKCDKEMTNGMANEAKKPLK